MGQVNDRPNARIRNPLRCVCRSFSIHLYCDHHRSELFVCFGRRQFSRPTREFRMECDGLETDRLRFILCPKVVRIHDFSFDLKCFSFVCSQTVASRNKMSRMSEILFWFWRSISKNIRQSKRRIYWFIVEHRNATFSRRIATFASLESRGEKLNNRLNVELEEARILLKNVYVNIPTPLANEETGNGSASEGQRAIAFFSDYRIRWNASSRSEPSNVWTAMQLR